MFSVLLLLLLLLLLLKFSIAEEEFCKSKHKPVIKRLHHSTNQLQPTERKARLDNNEQRSAASADIWSWSVIVRLAV
jgi:hypothetical protein